MSTPDVPFCAAATVATTVVLARCSVVGRDARSPITGGFNVGGPEKLRRPDFPDP
jgi:hypothetical protein